MTYTPRKAIAKYINKGENTNQSDKFGLTVAFNVTKNANKIKGAKLNKAPIVLRVSSFIRLTPLIVL